MVMAVTNLTKNGLSDWIVQRFTAIMLASYALFIFAFILMSEELKYEVWSGLFSMLWMKIFTLLALLSVFAHGWIGLWGVITDYITERMIGGKALSIRAIILFTYAILNLAFLVWGIDILWGRG